MSSPPPPCSPCHPTCYLLFISIFFSLIYVNKFPACLPHLPFLHTSSFSRFMPPVPCSTCTLFIFMSPSYHLHLSTPAQEYERAVIFRLGRLLSGGARGPGVFFIIPCIDQYEKIDMRTQTFDVPPQEVSFL